MHAIVGKNDPAVGEEYVRSTWMKTCNDSSLDVIADGGHYVMWEAPVTCSPASRRRLLADRPRSEMGDRSVRPEADKIRDWTAERLGTFDRWTKPSSQVASEGDHLSLLLGPDLRQADR